MVSQDDDSPQEESRPPSLEDLVRLARHLGARGVRYVVIGGIAMIQQGFTRATEDIDLLIEGSEANLRQAIDAVSQLPDHAARELDPADFSEYEVIRVADEIVVDLMVRASGLDFGAAENGIVFVEIEGVRVPFASAELLLKMKQGVREKDVLDRRFLEALLKR